MAITLTNEALTWVEILLSNGMMMVNSNGQAEFAPAVKPIIDTLHEVLAGGEANVQLKLKGDAAKKELFETQMQKALSSITVSATDPSVFSP